MALMRQNALCTHTWNVLLNPPLVKWNNLSSEDLIYWSSVYMADTSN